MKIDKVINNNIVSAFDMDGKEVVVMGRGLGYKAKKGQTISEDKIEKIFKLDSQSSVDKFKTLLEDMPLEHIQISNEIVTYAMKNLDKELNHNIYITLTDHISFAITRYEQGFKFSNPLLWEVKRFYKSEFKVGKYAVELINDKIGVQLLEDEAASIALHIVNAEYNTNVNEAINNTKILKNTLEIVKNYFDIEINVDSLYYERFVTHMMYLAQRIFKKKQLNSADEDNYRKIIEGLYQEDYKCSRKISDYIEKEYKYNLTDEELLYLTIHIKRLRTEE
jgi:beta-glucoside operon transcriptional antiterminator